jgi:hypothetical protein
MNRRYLVLGLSVGLALSLAVPAIGGPSNPVASKAATLAKAIKKAKRAQTTADAAQSTANTALSTANTANTTANQARTQAATAQTSANAAQTSANNANTAATNANNNANTRLQSTSTTTATSANNSTDKSVNAACPAGDVITGGGFGLGGTDSSQVVPNLSASYGDSWTAAAQENPATAANWSVTAYAICAST